MFGRRLGCFPLFLSYPLRPDQVHKVKVRFAIMPASFSPVPHTRHVCTVRWQNLVVVTVFVCCCLYIGRNVYVISARHPSWRKNDSGLNQAALFGSSAQGSTFHTPPSWYIFVSITIHHLSEQSSFLQQFRFYLCLCYLGTTSKDPVSFGALCFLCAINHTLTFNEGKKSIRKTVIYTYAYYSYCLNEWF